MAHILIIDDDESMRMLLRLMLESDGHEVSVAEDGEHALQQFDGSVQLVITDVLMPGMGGLQTIDCLRKLAPCIPIISMSGGGAVASEEYLGVARLVGADRTLAKPFSAAALRETMAGLFLHAVAPRIPLAGLNSRPAELAEVLKEGSLDARKLRLPAGELLAAIQDAILSALKPGRSSRRTRHDPQPGVTTAILAVVIYCYLYRIYGSEEIEEACRSDEALRAVHPKLSVEQDVLQKFRRLNRSLIQQSLKELYWFLWVKHATARPAHSGRLEGESPLRARVSPGLSERINFESNECLFRAAFMDRMLSDR